MKVGQSQRRRVTWHIKAGHPSVSQVEAWCSPEFLLRCKQPSEAQKSAQKSLAQVLLHYNNEELDEAHLDLLGLQEPEMKSKSQAQQKLFLLLGVNLQGVSIVSTENQLLREEGSQQIWTRCSLHVAPEPRKTIFGAPERRKRRMPINNHLSNCFCSFKGLGFSGSLSSTGQLGLISAENFLIIMSEASQWGVLKTDDFLSEIKALPEAGSFGSQMRQQKMRNSVTQPRRGNGPWDVT